MNRVERVEEADCLIVALHGEHDVFTAPDVREHVHGAVEQGRPVVVDLTPTTFIDSSILAALLGGLRRARENGTGYAIVLERRADAVGRILEVTGLWPVFPIRPTRDEAVATALAGPPAQAEDEMARDAPR